MGIFSNWLGTNKDKQQVIKANINWIPLTSINQLKTIVEESKNNVVIIFKHSTRCSISSMVKKQFEKLFTEEYQNLKIYYLDLIQFRDISNEIETISQVTHQSPQVIIFKNKEVVFNASHYDIVEINISSFI